MADYGLGTTVGSDRRLDDILECEPGMIIDALWDYSKCGTGDLTDDIALPGLVLGRIIEGSPDGLADSYNRPKVGYHSTSAIDGREDLYGILLNTIENADSTPNCPCQVLVLGKLNFHALLHQSGTVPDSVIIAGYSRGLFIDTGVDPHA